MGRQTNYPHTNYCLFLSTRTHAQPPPLCHRFLALAEDLQTAGTSKHERWMDRKTERGRTEQAEVTSSGRVGANKISWRGFKVVQLNHSSSTTTTHCVHSC